MKEFDKGKECGNVFEKPTGIFFFKGGGTHFSREQGHREFHSVFGKKQFVSLATKTVRFEGIRISRNS